jgi:hypothetical protein
MFRDITYFESRKYNQESNIDNNNVCNFVRITQNFGETQDERNLEFVTH